ncbi:cyclic nucleotide-binding domain-containing protein [Candidatus Latescibacterota bacterium]
MKEEEKARAEQKVRLLQFIQKIPIFSGLTSYKAKIILSLCSKKVLQEGEILCRQGEESNAMYILLQGKLGVMVKGSAPIATIHPVSSIGEMGVFTGEKRTATVQAMEKSNFLVLNKNDIEKLIEKDSQFGLTIMRKVIQILSERISDDNVKIREFQSYVIGQENSKNQ